MLTNYVQADRNVALDWSSGLFWVVFTGNDCIPSGQCK